MMLFVAYDAYVVWESGRETKTIGAIGQRVRGYTYTFAKKFLPAQRSNVLQMIYKLCAFRSAGVCKCIAQKLGPAET